MPLLCMRPHGNARPSDAPAWGRRTVPAWIGRVPPAGFEPAPLPPEGSALSPELRGLVPVVQSRRYQPVGDRRGGGPQGAGSGVPPRAVSIPAINVVSAVWLWRIDRARSRTAGSRAWSAAYWAMSLPP